jgi:ABC-type multidrug transport system fused ATPase/permease subunit
MRPISKFSASESDFSLLIQLSGYIGKKRWCQFLYLFLLMLLSSFAEIISIGSILPFLGALTVPERLFEIPFLSIFFHKFGLVKHDQLLVPLTVTFVLAIVIASSVRLALLRFSLQLSFIIGADLSSEIYRKTLHQPYDVHVRRNSSEVIGVMTAKLDTVIYNVIIPMITLASSIVMLVIVTITLGVIRPDLVLTVLLTGGGIYLLVYKITSQRLQRNSNTIADSTSLRIKSLQEGLSGIRDILIEGNQQTYCDAYRAADLQLRSAQASNSLVSQSPRHIVEAIGIVMIALVASFMFAGSDNSDLVIPIIGVIALGVQRMLPVLQQLYVNWTNIRGSQQSLKDVLALLDQEVPFYLTNSPQRLVFVKEIVLDNVSFRYRPDEPWVFKDLNLVIYRGSRVGILGQTGGGKSTLLDLIMGLLEPTQGHLQIDEQTIIGEAVRKWQKLIAHVPQSIYLSDASIANNIALGVPPEEIDFNRIKSAARDAQLLETIEGWDQGFNTLVGENGVRLSGGQRQRIGIARAFYKCADIIVFDEATSALDNETELSVIESIEKLSKKITVLMIAHRLSTLKSCDMLLQVEGGKVERIDSLESIMCSDRDLI